jgi:hypothetical protein
VSNLVWIIPLVVWLAFLVLVVPYRLVSKYHNKHESTLEKLADIWVLGNKIKTEIYRGYHEETADNVHELFKQWMESVRDVFMLNRNELGLAKFMSLDIENQDAVAIPIPEGWDKSNPVTGYYILLVARLSKLNKIMQSLLDDKR